MITHLFDVALGKTTLSKPRSKHWPALRRWHLSIQPECQVCGAELDLVVHHRLPFHLFPGEELSPHNLITMCHECHLFVGHLGSYFSYNENVLEDAEIWRAKIAKRP